jgi:hypothetical protein
MAVYRFTLVGALAMVLAVALTPALADTPPKKQSGGVDVQLAEHERGHEGETEKKLKSAFGKDSTEAKRSIKLYFRAKGILVAADRLEIQGCRLKLSPFSMALFGKDVGSIAEIKTVQCEVVFLTLDREVTSIADLSNRHILNMELTGRTGVQIRSTSNPDPGVPAKNSSLGFSSPSLGGYPGTLGADRGLNTAPPPVKPVYVNPSSGEKKPAEKKPALRVGQVIIVGNSKTPDAVIRKHIGLFPGQDLDFRALPIAERNLAKLNLFVVDAEKGIRPTIIVLDPETPHEYIDLLVQVEELQPARDAVEMLKQEVDEMRQRLKFLQEQLSHREDLGTGEPQKQEIDALKNDGAQRDFATAEFYRRTGHPESAFFYYELVRRRYPGTPFAAMAQQRMAKQRADDLKKPTTY